ncbi:hypothetical protein [Vibrio genomosp. F10]|uniref:hypothetical protein n=1 Tax=Vibrio genomosp. F10 TaxID=723171 RepID=UPI000307FADB|nr:hypothetical protein [Vibrio genomosp. F10]OEF04548.1 hypothetical protein A1QI_10810 [Vibrio genomosp. F10 str. 9ZB36]
MRVSPARRKRWNNLLMLAIVCFIGVLYLPTIIKTYLIEPPHSPYPYLLNPDAELQSLHFSQWSLEKNQGRWRISVPSNVAPEELADRWQALVGTEVDDKTRQALNPTLINPQTIEVWYVDQEEPQRITYYQTPQFWLLKNWQEKWIALSAEVNYLIPSS